MRFIIIAGIFSAVLFALGGGVLVASEDIKVERVSFERGKNSATIERSITGYAEFKPYWNLTPHIARTETLRHLRSDLKTTCWKNISSCSRAGAAMPG